MSLLSQDDETEITRILKQAESDEQEAQRILNDISPEEAQLNKEYETAQQEYDEIIRQIAVEDAIQNGTLDDGTCNRTTMQTDLNAWRTYNGLPPNDILASLVEPTSCDYETVYKEIEKASEEIQYSYGPHQEQLKNFLDEQDKIKKYTEIQALGLIPPGISDWEFEGYYKKYQEEIKKEDESNFVIDNVALKSIITSGSQDQKDMVDKFKKLIEAHNQFQKDFKKDILNFRFNKQDIAGTRDQCMYQQYNMQYLSMDCVYRRFLTLKPVEGSYDDYIEYRWDDNKKTWSRVNSTWNTGGASVANTNSSVKFFRDGHFPSDLIGVPEYWNGSNPAPSSGVLRFFKKPSSDFTPGKFNKKYAFQKCSPGYWFYESLPEESSICVYMGGSWADSRPSYYPASVGFSYKVRGTQEEAQQMITAAKTPNPYFGNQTYCNKTGVNASSYLGDYACRQFLEG